MPKHLIENPLTQDWIGYKPIFYNLNGFSSDNINDLIDYGNLELDPAGLTAYLNFGYSVFGRTPIKGIYFLRQNESINYIDNRVIKNVLNEPVETQIRSDMCETEVWALFESKIKDLVGNERTVVPLSGGFDSRLIAFFSCRNTEIETFSYGVSREQKKSIEVKRAKEFASVINVPWSHIELSGFHRYLEEWDMQFGASTHAHGMYHIDFYNQIKQRTSTRFILSGIVGDAWAGSLSLKKPKNRQEFIDLGLSHGVRIESSIYKQEDWTLIDEEFESIKNKLNSEIYRTLYLIRNKMMLLSYLIGIPNSLGFEVKSPYLDFELASAMLSLDPRRRESRIWQKEFMVKNNIDDKSLNTFGSHRNDLDFLELSYNPPPPLSISLLSDHFNVEKINQINNNLIYASRHFARFLNLIYQARYIGPTLQKIRYKDNYLDLYYAYLILKPIENILRKAREFSR